MCLSFGQGGDVYASDVELQPQSARFNLHTPQGAAGVVEFTLCRCSIMCRMRQPLLPLRSAIGIALG